MKSYCDNFSLIKQVTLIRKCYLVIVSTSYTFVTNLLLYTNLNYRKRIVIKEFIDKGKQKSSSNIHCQPTTVYYDRAKGRYSGVRVLPWLRGFGGRDCNHWGKAVAKAFLPFTGRNTNRWLPVKQLTFCRANNFSRRLSV